MRYEIMLKLNSTIYKVLLIYTTLLCYLYVEKNKTFYPIHFLKTITRERYFSVKCL